jgi:hypothetical protein
MNLVAKIDNSPDIDGNGYPFFVEAAYAFGEGRRESGDESFACPSIGTTPGERGVWEPPFLYETVICRRLPKKRPHYKRGAVKVRERERRAPPRPPTR